MANNVGQAQYGDGTNSSVGSQFNTFLYRKKALVDAVKEAYFGQLADTEAMPKHFGKTIKKFHYIPLLDDANINDQGIDADGLSSKKVVTIQIGKSDGSIPNIEGTEGSFGRLVRFVGSGANAAAAKDAAVLAVVNWAETLVNAGGLGLTLVGATPALKFANAVNPTNGQAYTLGYRFTNISTTADLVDESTLAATAVASYGNLYGSSKDVGTIASKLPLLSETGGRVNRVGFKRVELQGSIAKYGFFDEYTKDSLDFDTDAELEMHINREMVRGAHEINEDLIQMDLLNQAGVIRFGGVATATVELTGEGVNKSEPTFGDLLRLNIDLNNNRCPKDTTYITGSSMVDTKTINAARVMYVGSEVVPMLKGMKDNHNLPAFISVEKYGNAGNVLRGEIGTIDQFRIVVVPEMMHWDGAGAIVGTNEGYRETGGNYDVFPMLVVGSKSFTTIGFQVSGKEFKFKVKHAKPESPESYAADPYGETGFMSIKWWYGTLIQRPEWIALVKTVASW